MSNDFVFDSKSAGLIVRIHGDRALPVGEWTLRGPSGAGVLSRLRDDGGATECDDGSALCVSWKSVAELTSDELRYVGLPDAAPFALEVVANGAIQDPDFEVRCGYIRKGRRVLRVQRQGAWLSVAGEDFVLLDPLYSIADAIDRFNRAEESDIESRMLRWGRIAEMLPADTVVGDDNLRSLRISVASSFEIHPFLNDKAEPDFDPVVGRQETRATEAGEEEQVFAPGMPPARQREFARRFRGLSGVKHRYASGGGTYVVLTPEVERALTVVRRAQDGTPDERRDFLRNVSGYLRGAFDDDSNYVELDSIFSDEGLSERVKGVGIWADKVLPWIKQAKEPWMPPEEFGILIGGQRVAIPPEELEPVLDHVRAAVQRGESTVKVRISTQGEIEIPANSETIGSLEEIRAIDPPSGGGGGGGGGPCKPKPESKDQVLLVIDNLDDLGFHRERKQRTPGVSGTAPDLRTNPLPHQQKGLTWLQAHWEAGNWGALLADDMGLGKTLEALAFLSSLKRHVEAEDLPHQPLLVVAPTGLLKNWKDEHDRHLSGAGLGRVVEAHGSALRHLRKGASGRGELPGGQPLLDLQALEDADWVLTTYETLRDYQHSFGRIRWRAGIFDEAQKIKNPGARVTDAALAMNIDFALMMTGTPVENRPADIWSMLDRAEPGMFGTLKDFSRKYESKTDGDSALADLHSTLTSRTNTALPLMLRRLKEDHVPELPEKEVHRRVVEMPQEQAEAYAEIVIGGGPELGGNMLQTLHRLRSISLHPASPDELDIDKYIQGSARLSETFRILHEIAECGEKALVFVEARWMQDFLVGTLRRRFSLAEDVLVINGTVAGETRKARVDTFQDRTGFDVMILSPRAGGVGLTLTAANHVIHLSRWWNPAVEDQCTDRVFRIGQSRPVHVYLPIARHPRFGDYSFDVKLESLIEGKREMNRRVLAPTAATREDMGELYRTTVTQAQGSDAPSDVPMKRIDIMEPEAFEEWVLGELAEAGYDTRKTPRSGDRGADGLAFFDGGGEQHTILVQCKHTQPDAKCGPAAVEEVLYSVPVYDDAIRGDARPIVVTNAAGFTREAELLAGQKDVQLIARQGLSQLRTLTNRPS